MDCIIADMVILCNSIIKGQLGNFDKEYYQIKSKLIKRNYKSKCDIDMPMYK
jgi:hypothetical protein